MQLISELEGMARGPYAGCVGYFSFNGNLKMCALTQTLFHPMGEGESFRTASLKDGKACVQVPTCRDWANDSEPEAEFHETVNKSKAMLKAVALAETFAKSP